MKPIFHQVNQYLDYCEHTRNMSPATLRAKRSVYYRFIKATRISSLEELGNDSFNLWVKAALSRGASPRTVNTYNANIMAMLTYYREMGLRIPLKTPLVRKLKEGATRRDFYTRSQIKEVLKFADPTTALMIKIAFDGGLRIAELTNLRLANLQDNRLNLSAKATNLVKSISRALPQTASIAILINIILPTISGRAPAGKGYHSPSMPSASVSVSHSTLPATMIFIHMPFVIALPPI